MGRNDPCWCGSGKKYKKCHMAQDKLVAGSAESTSTLVAPTRLLTKGQVSPMRSVPAHIPCPEYAETGGTERDQSAPGRLAPSDIERMREACRAARRVLDQAIRAVRPGITTDDLDAIVHEACIAEGGYPSPLNYRGFPKSVCTSVNEVICHGIPDDRPLENHDIVNIDVTIFLKGFYGDCSETVPVGEIDQASHKLLTVTRECMLKGIAAIYPHGMIRDIGRAVEEHAKTAGYSVVRAYCGHGIGKSFHISPSVPHFYDPKERGRIRPGMIFTVEPMINMGGWEHRLWDDGWTAVTADGQRSAQFEHTLLVAEDGPEILTGKTT